MALERFCRWQIYARYQDDENDEQKVYVCNLDDIGAGLFCGRESDKGIATKCNFNLSGIYKGEDSLLRMAARDGDGRITDYCEDFEAAEGIEMEGSKKGGD